MIFNNFLNKAIIIVDLDYYLNTIINKRTLNANELEPIKMIFGYIKSGRKNVNEQHQVIYSYAETNINSIYDYINYHSKLKYTFKDM